MSLSESKKYSTSETDTGAATGVDFFLLFFVRAFPLSALLLVSSNKLPADPIFSTFALCTNKYFKWIGLKQYSSYFTFISFLINYANLFQDTTYQTLIPSNKQLHIVEIDCCSLAMPE